MFLKNDMETTLIIKKTDTNLYGQVLAEKAVPEEELPLSKLDWPKRATLDEILPGAFCAGSRSCQRTLKQRPF